MTRHLAGAVARFGAVLRRQGLPVTLIHVTDGVRALEHLDLADRNEVYLGLRAISAARRALMPGTLRSTIRSSLSKGG